MAQSLTISAVIEGTGTALFIGLLLALAQFGNSINMPSSNGCEVMAGWPYTYFVRMLRSDSAPQPEHWDGLALYSDILISVLLSVGAGMGMARFVVNSCWPPRFSLQSMFGWTFVAAMLLGSIPVYIQLSKNLGRNDPAYLPPMVLFAFMLTLYAAGPTFLKLARRFLNLVHRSEKLATNSS